MPEHTPAPTPSRAVYGFVMYLAFRLIFILFLIWVYVPTHWLKSLGITYLPSSYWALAVPIFMLTTLTVFAFVIYPSLGLLMTPNDNDLRVIQDSKSKIHKPKLEHSIPSCTTACTCKNLENCKKKEFDQIKHLLSENSIPPLQILNITDVSKNLYLK